MLNGHVALVTGATRGIGRAIALAIGRAGAAVIGTATTSEGADSISSTLNAAGIVGEGLRLNVTDRLSCDEVLEVITSKYGAITILVNNAGMTRDNLAARMRDEDFTEILETNLLSVFRLSRGVMRGMMKARQGRIVNITSVVGHTGNPGQANYCAAKAGVTGLTRSLARELGGRNITVNCVAPGLIDTDMTRALDEKLREQMLAAVPLGRMGTPDDVASAVLFLVSPSAAYVTGATIHVNGGMYME